MNTTYKTRGAPTIGEQVKHLRPSNVNFDELWDKIQGTVRLVITCEPVLKPDWQERFSDIYKICTSNTDGLDARLYQETHTFFQEHSLKIYQTILGEQSLIKSYHENWEKYKYGTNCINGLYRYLNEHYSYRRKKTNYVEHFTPMPLQEGDKKNIGEMAFEMWREKIIDPLKHDLINALLDEIKKDRIGETTNENVVKGVIFSFIDVHRFETKQGETKLKLYESDFERHLLNETCHFYQNEADNLRKKCNCLQYMENVDRRLQEENMRVTKYLHRSTFEKVKKVAQEKLVEDHLDFLTGECRTMIRQQQDKDLQRMYELLKPLPKGFTEMLGEFEKHIFESGLEALKVLPSANDTGSFVNVLLELHMDYTSLVDSTFKKDQAFFGARDKIIERYKKWRKEMLFDICDRYSLENIFDYFEQKVACTKVVNYRFDTKKVCRSPELLAKYCDSLLKKSNKNLPEGEIDEKLNNVITIFKYIDDKDVFQKFYSKLLAKRLIHNLSVSMDTEESMITKLKLACGYEYTNKLHRMFTDMTISRELETKFSNYLQEKNSHMDINFSILVLQSGAWPLGQAVCPTVLLPEEFSKCAQHFKTFYNKTFNGRKLTWLQNVSNGELKITYLKKPYLITCTTYQMAVMLLFNDQTQLTYSYIAKHTELEEKELGRTIQSIVDVQLFGKAPVDGDLSGCTFSLNYSFTNKRTKFKITSAVQKETPQETEQTHSAIDEDRKMYTQASIVRIMKSRQILKHNILIQEVINQSRSQFSPSTQMIKKCVEALIEKNYLERVAGSRDEYSYVA